MIDRQKISFHESTVLGLFKKDDDIVMEFEDVLVDELKTSVLIKVSNVEEIYIDETNTADISMEANDGEILCLEINIDEISMIIEWNDFSTNDSITYSYKIKGESVKIFQLIE